MKILVVIGTRPEAIKMAPIIKEFSTYKQFIDYKVVVTAQHREMLDQVLKLFSIIPDYDLDIMKQDQSLFDITSQIISRMQGIYEKERPDLVLVHGDTTTTFASALGAFYLQIPVGHVEAGLRTYNNYSPFPEEVNRRLTGILADLHFAPTKRAKENLLREGVTGHKIFVTGNTVIDALKATVTVDYRFADPKLNEIDFTKKVILLTTHRRENLGENLAAVYRAINRLLDLHPDIQIVFPVHKNPVVRATVNEYLGGHTRIYLTEPMDYQSFANLIARCFLVITDSGGIQEEAPSLGKPVLVLRETTERPEAVEAGTVVMVGCDEDRIIKVASTLLENNIEYDRMANRVNPFGDGEAARRIVMAIAYQFGFANSPPDEWNG